MAGERTLKVTILGDADKLKRAFGDAETATARFSDGAHKAALAVGALAVGAGAFAYSTLGKASEVQETMSKLDAIFSGAADSAQVYAEDVANAHKAAEKAQDNYRDAVEKSEARIADVRDKAREKAAEAAQKIEDAEEHKTDVVKDQTAKVKDAKDDEADVFERSAQRIKDAEADETERIERAGDRKSDAYDRAADRRKEAADRVIEAEAALREAQEKGADAEKIERLTKRVNDAREDQGKVTTRTAKDMERADKDYQRASEDAHKATERVKRDAAKANEDAAERVKKAEEAQTKAVEAAEKAIAKARAEAAKIYDETAKAEDKIRAGLVTSRDEANRAQAEVARLEHEIAVSRANVVKDGGKAHQQWVAELEKFAESATTNYGLSKREALSASATFAVFGKAAGLTGKDLADFSTNLTGLSGDLTSFHNPAGGSAQAIEAIGAALRGESEPLRAFGVSLNDATLKAKAMSLGIYDGTGALTSQQKTMAAYRIILDQTKDAQGDYVRTSDSFANQQRTLTKEFDNLQVAIGERLLPVINAVLGWANDLTAAFKKDGLNGALEFAREEFSKLLDKLGPVGDGLRKIGDAITPVVDWFKDFAKQNPSAFLAGLGAVIATAVLPPMIAWVAATVAALAPWVALAAAIGAFTAAVVWAYQNVGWFRTAVDAVVKFFREDFLPLLETAVDLYLTPFRIAIDLGTTAFNEGLLPAAKAVWKFFSETLWPILETIGEWFGKGVGVALDLAKGAFNVASDAIGLALAPVKLAVDGIKSVLDILPGAVALITGPFQAAFDAIKIAIGPVLTLLEKVVGFLGSINSGPAVPDPIAARLGANGLGVAAGPSAQLGTSPTNSQGSPGQTFAQMAASGMTVAEIAEKTGLDPAVIQANLTVANAGAFIGSVLGGDHDDENDGDMSPSGPGEQNLTANAVKLRRQIQASFKGYSSIGGYAYRTTAAGTPSDHATGKALDVMMPRLHDPLGDKIAAWAVGENETKYVIWDNQIWSRQKPYWRDYATSGKVGAANQGSATGRHEDHVHISVLGKGGIVRARQGGTLALLGEAGQDEAVVPLPRGGGSAGVGTTVVVHVHGNVIRERDLVLSIRDGLLDLQRQGVSLGFN